MKKLLLLLAVVGMIFTACQGGLDNEENGGTPSTPKIELSQQNIEVDFEPAQYSVSVTSPYSWEAVSENDWIQVETTKGNAGTELLSFKVEQNTETENRKGTIVIKNSDYNLIAELRIMQKALSIETDIDTTTIIVYTSSDGLVVKPDKTDVFGANIISNIYENGKGVIKFDAPVTSIGDYAFDSCRRLTSVTIPDSVTSIGGNAFEDCSSLTSITIPNSVVGEIGYAVFRDCTSLISVTIGDSVTSIGKCAFDGCSSLKSVRIGHGVTEIVGEAFSCCTSLASITIPDSVTSIGGYAFYGCSSLTSVYCKPMTPPSVDYEDDEDDMFYKCAPSITIYVPYESVDAYKSALGWRNHDSDIIGYDF